MEETTQPVQEPQHEPVKETPQETNKVLLFLLVLCFAILVGVVAYLYGAGKIGTNSFTPEPAATEITDIEEEVEDKEVLGEKTEPSVTPTPTATAKATATSKATINPNLLLPDLKIKIVTPSPTPVPTIKANLQLPKIDLSY